jgi:anti-sigma factor RsiW
MECRDARPLLDAFVSEQLLVETTQSIVAHLERCAACRAEADGLRRLRLATRSAFESSAELRPSAEFLSALPRRLQRTAAPQRPGRARDRTWLAFAASLLLLIGIGWGLRQWSASAMTALLHAAVGDHRFCALTFQLAEPPIPLDEAARRFGGIHKLLQAVQPSTDTLSGGALAIVERHSCVFDDRRFVHLVLRYKDTPVSLLVAVDQGLSGGSLLNIGLPPPGSAHALPVGDGLHVASFRGARHLVFVVSSLEDPDLREVTRAMAGPVSQALGGA